MTESPLRVALVCQRYHSYRSQGRYHDALGRRFRLTRVVVEEDGWPERLSDLPDGGEFDAVIWRVRFRELSQRSFDWGSFQGFRIMIDNDTFKNYYELWPESGDVGAYTPVIRNWKFDLVCASGKRPAELLRQDGLPAVWIPKAYDAAAFFDGGSDREGAAHFGAMYRARRKMLHRLGRSGVEVEHFRCEPLELNDYLNRYLAIVICNMGSKPYGTIGRGVSHYFHEWGFRCVRAPETMLKNIEVAGSGAVPVCDPTPDLADLGFVDGVNAIVYSDFDDLVDRLPMFLLQPDRLRQMGAAAAALARRRHTWDHRAAFLDRLLRSGDPVGSGLYWDTSDASLV
jgi:glycosyl transferase family 1